jgi:hypothetical protein
MMSHGLSLSEAVANHLSGEVMIIVSVRSGPDRATIGRSTGARYSPEDGLVHLYVSATQWSETVDFARPGGPIAATFTRPDNYLSYQIKGRIQTVAVASDDEVSAAKAYVERVLALMSGLGVTRMQLSHTFAQSQLMRISLMPLELFDQTPGPQAGTRLHEGAQ